MGSDAYEGSERRRGTSTSLEDIKDGIGRIALQLESERKFRDWVHEKFHDLKDTIFGNGKKGLIRDVDAIGQKVDVLEKNFEKMDARIDKVLGWALASSVSALGLIAFEVVMMVLRHGHS